MRKLLVLSILFVIFLQPVLGDSFFSEDKIDHLFTTFAITASTSLFSKSMLKDSINFETVSFSISLPIIFSFGKEIYDHFYDGGVSYKDLIYDFIGIGLGFFVVRLK